MAEKTLEQRVEERKQQARSKKFFDKIAYVCQELGAIEKKNVVIDYDDYNSYTRTSYSLKRENLGLKYTIGNNHENNRDVEVVVFEDSSAWIFHRKTPRTVFTESIVSGVTSYIPGPWEKKVDLLYQDLLAKEAIQTEETERQNKNYLENDLREKFGL